MKIVVQVPCEDPSCGMHREGHLTSTQLTIREFRKALARDAAKEEKERLKNSCTCCGKRLGHNRYNGGAGRVLCEVCGPDEAAPLIRKRKARKP